MVIDAKGDRAAKSCQGCGGHAAGRCAADTGAAVDGIAGDEVSGSNSHACANACCAGALPGGKLTRNSIGIGRAAASVLTLSGLEHMQHLSQVVESAAEGTGIENAARHAPRLVALRPGNQPKAVVHNDRKTR